MFWCGLSARQAAVSCSERGSICGLGPSAMQPKIQPPSCMSVAAVQQRLLRDSGPREKSVDRRLQVARRRCARVCFHSLRAAWPRAGNHGCGVLSLRPTRARGSSPELSPKPNSMRCSKSTGQVGTCVSRFPAGGSQDRWLQNASRSAKLDHSAVCRFTQNTMRAADTPANNKRRAAALARAFGL